MGGAPANFLYRNLANATSLLGVLPLAVLFLDDGYRYVILLIIYNNFMDDLDGVLAFRFGLGDYGRRDAVPSQASGFTGNRGCSPFSAVMI